MAKSGHATRIALATIAAAALASISAPPASAVSASVDCVATEAVTASMTVGQTLDIAYGNCQAVQLSNGAPSGLTNASGTMNVPPDGATWESPISGTLAYAPAAEGTAVVTVKHLISNVTTTLTVTVSAAAASPADTPPPTYTINLDPNGGTCTASSLAGVSGTWLAIPGTCSRSDGYYFTGWATSPTGFGSTFSPGQQLHLTGDNTIYARWRALPTPIVATGVHQGLPLLDITYDAPAGIRVTGFEVAWAAGRLGQVPPSSSIDVTTLVGPQSGFVTTSWQGQLPPGTTSLQVTALTSAGRSPASLVTQVWTPEELGELRSILNNYTDGGRRVTVLWKGVKTSTYEVQGYVGDRVVATGTPVPVAASYAKRGWTNAFRLELPLGASTVVVERNDAGVTKALSSVDLMLGEKPTLNPVQLDAVSFAAPLGPIIELTLAEPQEVLHPVVWSLHWAPDGDPNNWHQFTPDQIVYTDPTHVRLSGFPANTRGHVRVSASNAIGTACYSSCASYRDFPVTSFAPIPRFEAPDAEVVEGDAVVVKWAAPENAATDAGYESLLVATEVGSKYVIILKNLGPSATVVDGEERLSWKDPVWSAMHRDEGVVFMIFTRPASQATWLIKSATSAPSLPVNEVPAAGYLPTPQLEYDVRSRRVAFVTVTPSSEDYARSIRWYEVEGQSITGQQESAWSTDGLSITDGKLGRDGGFFRAEFGDASKIRIRIKSCGSKGFCSVWREVAVLDRDYTG